MLRRNGSSLVEVLVAIFVMGLGLIALLTLFPIGMLRMMQAIRDDRVSQSVRIAHATSIFNGVRTDTAVITDGGLIADVFAHANPAGTFPPADPMGESYAVLVDPIGRLPSPIGPNWVGGAALPGLLRRCTVTAFNVRSFTLLDDIKFENTYDPALATMPGTPYRLGVGLNMFRDYRYSWAYLLRRPQTNEPAVVDCTVVVFEGRDALTLPEYVYDQSTGNPSYFDPVKNTITIDYTNNVPPPIRPGNWILDATIWTYNPAVLPYVYNAAGTKAAQHAYFYQVVGTEEITLAGPRTLVRYEVASPLRGMNHMQPVPDPTSLLVPPPTVGLGTVIVLDSVADVYEKGPARLP